MIKRHNLTKKCSNTRTRIHKRSILIIAIIIHTTGNKVKRQIVHIKLRRIDTHLRMIQLQRNPKPMQPKYIRVKRWNTQGIRTDINTLMQRNSITSIDKLNTDRVNNTRRNRKRLILGHIIPRIAIYSMRNKRLLTHKLFY